MIVTNASLYRLKPSVSDLEDIRAAVKPEDIADLVPWTWCYYDVPVRLSDQNYNSIQEHLTRQAELVYRFPGLEDSMYDLADRPNWIAVINIRSLPEVLAQLMVAFNDLSTVKVDSFLGRPPRAKRPRR